MTQDELNTIRWMAALGKSADDMARELHYHRNSIYYHIKKHGIEYKPKHKAKLWSVKNRNTGERAQGTAVELHELVGVSLRSFYRCASVGHSKLYDIEEAV